MKKAILTLLTLAVTFVSFAKENNNNNNKSVSYGSNLLSFAPISVIDRGMGIGLTYERMLDQEQKVSFVLPLDLVFVDPNISSDDSKVFYTYLSPGVIFYPAGLRKINYGIGTNLMLGYGSGSEWVFDNQWNNQMLTEFTNFRMGMMVNNYLLMNIKHNLSLSLNFGMGLRYINSYNYTVQGFGNNNSNVVDVIGQFKFQFGYRF